MLISMLDDWSSPAADIYAVYRERKDLSAKVVAFIEFPSIRFREYQKWD